jgi:hypothetical protein
MVFRFDEFELDPERLELRRAGVLDAGAPIALERGDMRALVREALKTGARLVVPAGVLGQARRGSARQAPLRALVKGPTTVVPALDKVLAEAVDVLCGTRLPPSCWHRRSPTRSSRASASSWTSRRPDSMPISAPACSGPFTGDMQLDLGTYLGVHGDESVATPLLGLSIRR